MNTTTIRGTTRNALVGLSLALVVALAGCGTHGSSAAPSSAGKAPAVQTISSIRVVESAGEDGKAKVWLIRTETSKNEAIFKLADSKSIRRLANLAHPDHIICCDQKMYLLKVTYKNGKVVTTQLQGSIKGTTAGHLISDVMAAASPVATR